MINWGHVDSGECDPRLVVAVKKRLEPLPTLWLVTYGWRSTAEQAALYQAFLAGGPKAAPPGLSPHEYGLAIDVVLDIDGKVGGAVSWDTKKYAKQWNGLWAAVDASPELHSGRFFQDADHIEMVKWRRLLAVAKAA
jgi:hypothetical protein